MARSLLLASLATLVVLPACTTRFTDTFEADTAGAAPLIEPAGTPDDRVYILDGSGSVRVTNSGPIAGAKSLRMQGPAGDNASAPNTFMYAESLQDPSQDVYALWSGRLSSRAAARVFFFTGHFSSMVTVELRNGTVRANGNAIGTYTPGQTHSILLRASPSNDSFGISVFGPGGSGSGTGAVGNAATFPQGNIGLTFQLIGGGSGQSYVIDDVSMSERNPPEDAPSG